MMLRLTITLGLALAGAANGFSSAQETRLAAGQGPVIRLERTNDAKAPVRFVVTGIEPAELGRLAKAKFNRQHWQSVFALFVDNGGKAGQPAVIGAYRIADAGLVFEPKYPLEPGVSYRAVFDGSSAAGVNGKASTATASFRIPKVAPAAATVVEQVYPTRDRLPENQLKFYIHFSAPMSRGEAYKHVRLLDAAGKAVALPFLELDEELWDPTGKRFTLFFDPGRIKRGLKPREEVGPVLEEGKSYTFVIDRGWPDAGGNPLKESYRKSFTVTAPDDEPIDPKRWKIQPPEPGKTSALVVTFPEPLDHALLHRLLTVADSSGRAVAGNVTVGDEETRWVFTPGQPWHAGGYRLVIETTLEDLAGNQVGKPFEVDVFRRVQNSIRPKYVTLNFEVKRKP